MPGHKIMPSLRTSRKASRNSSPAVRPVSENTPPLENRSEKKQQTLPSLWRNEPPLKAPVPSFEDHGLERHGVLEKMAPLGTLPPAKLKLTIGNANKKKPGGRSLSSVASPAVATPEVTPPLERRVGQQESDEQPPAKRLRTEEKEMVDAVNGVDVVEDETPLPSPQTAGKITTPLTAQSRRQSSASKSNTKSPLKRSLFTRPNQYAYDQILEAAIDHCKEAGNENLGAYLKHFYHESYCDRDLADVVDNILEQKPSETDLQKFKDGLLNGRIAVHKENRDLRAEIRSERDLSRQEAVTRRSQKQLPTTPISPRAPSIEKPSTPKLKSPPNLKERRSAAGSTRSFNMGSVNHWPDEETNGVTTRTRSTRQTRTSTAAAKIVEPAPVSPVLQTPPAQTGRETRSKRRERADSSSSDLSSVDEELVEKGPPGSLGVGAKRNAIEAELDLLDEETAAKRRQFNLELDERRSKFETPGMSFIRGVNTQPRSGIVLSFNSGRSTRSNAQRRTQGESEATAIDTPQSSPKAQGLGSTLRSSRSLGPPDRQNQKRTGARTKISPIKDRSTVAGVPRNNRYVANQASRQASPSRGDITDEDMSSSDENYDYCVACGEAGRLLCCDGCENAFHFKCCDPPLKSKTPILDEPYFCYSCQSAGRDVEVPEQGLFGQLFDKLKSTNVASFQLPKAIQMFYKGVGAKENGEYYDASAPPVVVRGRNNKDWEELGPDGRPKEKTMICRACKQSSLGGKTIIQCDSCNTHWHLDCLDPPQANPPKISTNGKTRAYFRCPLHIENDLRLIGNPQLAFRNPDGSAERGHKLRQPRNPTIYTPVLQRGHINNGVIEVDLDEDSEEPESNSVPKLHERAITLDFIEKAKKERLEREYRSKEATAIAKLDPANMLAHMQSYLHSEVNRLVEQQVQFQMAEFNRQQMDAEQDFLNRPPKEQRMALWLTRFAKEHEETNVDAGNLAVLARAVSSVDPVGSVSHVSLNDLRALQGVINNALAAAEKGNVPDNADLFDHDVQMGNKEHIEPPTSRNLTPNHALLNVTSPSTVAPTTLSLRNAASSSPNVPVHVSLSLSSTKDMLPETQETTTTITAHKKTTEEEAAASSDSTSQVSHSVKSVSRDFSQARASINDEHQAKKEETQATAEIEAEAASGRLTSPDKYAAAGTSPSAVPSLDEEEEKEDEERYDASESASAAGQSEDSTSLANNKPLWTRRFVGSERQDDQENEAPATNEETKVKIDASDETFSNNLTVPTGKSRGDRSRSYTSVSEVE